MANAKILIVEDEMISAAALRNDLKKMGYEVCSLAATGEKAIRIAEAERPDIVLMDVQLRGEMNGIEASREIFARMGAPSIFMSGYSQETLKEMAGENESFITVSKPIEKEDVRDAIGVVLGRKNAHKSKCNTRE